MNDWENKSLYKEAVALGESPKPLEEVLAEAEKLPQVFMLLAVSIKTKRMQNFAQFCPIFGA